MSQSTHSFARLLAVLFAASAVSSQITGTYPAVPLTEKHYSYPTGLPEQADTDAGLIRGSQFGYNRCNSTTEGPDSLCQTSFLNSIDDFCLWAPPKPNSTIGDTEGEEVAWCTKPGRGTRIFYQNTLQGVQFMRTPDYVQVVGFIDQTYINLMADDYGGELDPHGADLRGNPLGGLVYSTAFGPKDGNDYQQVIEWHNFMGGQAFCFKVCDPNGPNAKHFCEHIFDRIGCAYNAPNNAQNGTFESCLGDNQDYPGVYTSNGAVMTYTQPPEALGPISSMPYQPKVPASSSCTTYTSSVLYSALTALPPGVTSAPSSPSGSTTKGGSGTGTGAGSNPTGTSSDATALAVGGLASILGVVFSALFLA